MDITVRLARGQEGLDELLAGSFAFRVWLQPVDGEPGVYRLAKVDAGDPSALALARVFAYDECPWEPGLERPTVDGIEMPPMGEATGEVREQEIAWVALFDRLGGEVEHELPELPEPGDGR